MSLPLEMVSTQNVSAAFIGGIALASGFFGLSCAQFYSYLHDFSHERLVTKVSTFTIWLVGLAHAVVAVKMFESLLGFVYASEMGELPLDWNYKLQALLCLVLVILIDVAYTIRIWKFSWLRGNWVLPILVFLTMLVANGFSIYVVVLNFVDISSINSWLIYTTKSVQSLKFLVIAALMCFYLMHRPIGFTTSGSALARLVRSTLGSGCLAAGFAVGTLICVLVCQAFTPVGYSTLVLEVVVGGLYVNAYLSLLNSRSNAPSTCIESVRSSIISTHRGGHRPSNSWSTYATYTSGGPVGHVCKPSAPRADVAAGGIVETEKGVGSKVGGDLEKAVVATNATQAGEEDGGVPPPSERESVRNANVDDVDFYFDARSRFEMNASPLDNLGARLPLGAMRPQSFPSGLGSGVSRSS